MDNQDGEQTLEVGAFYVNLKHIFQCNVAAFSSSNIKFIDQFA